MNAAARTFEDTPAVRGESPLLIGIMSPSGGGKTFSALRLATGIQQVYGGDIYGIDTENERMKAYADDFKFRHVPFKPPFGSLDYLAAIRHCVGKGSRITIVDSMTHEHIGQGGYLETAEARVERIAGDDYRKREQAKWAGWAAAGPLRQKMIEGIKQLDGTFIFCFRAKERVKPVKVNGKTEAVEMGFMPIGGEEWIYEQAVNILLLPRAEGVPTWRSDHVGERLMMKLPKQFKHIFKDGEPLSEDIGRQLAEWAKGGKSSMGDAPTREDGEGAKSNQVSRPLVRPVNTSPASQPAKMTPEQWATAAVAEIAKLKDVPAINAWLTANQKPLDKLATKDPHLATQIQDAINERTDRVNVLAAG